MRDFILVKVSEPIPIRQIRLDFPLVTLIVVGELQLRHQAGLRIQGLGNCQIHEPETDGLSQRVFIFTRQPQSVWTQFERYLIL